MTKSFSSPGRAVASTRAPRATASWTAGAPTPPVAPETGTVSPLSGDTASTLFIRALAEAVPPEVADVLSTVGSRLSEEKTLITHMHKGLGRARPRPAC
ncbi:hypothetical protein [Streptomyces lancefieldiae]|uniref:Uncharacterized protein n=1 Tax=Streptomyces lancefieldiae TaxID=3075520 RepID=A0ABU3AV86_9ACTN|nr:hypothetical protein [Streptomyces sp. DSM 40712]MDT0614112.1 hypothetical protein [Streptomyces sp. DSM 40712]